MKQTKEELEAQLRDLFDEEQELISALIKLSTIPHATEALITALVSNLDIQQHILNLYTTGKFSDEQEAG